MKSLPSPIILALLFASFAFPRSAAARHKTDGPPPVPTQPWPPAYLAKLPADYLARIYQSRLATFAIGNKISQAEALKVPGSNTKTVLYIHWAQAGLMLGLRVADINQFVASPAFFWGQEDTFGFGFFATEEFRFYALYKADSPYLPGRLTPAAQANIEKGIWAVAKSYAKLTAARQSPWIQHGSENHNLMQMVGEMFAAQFLRHIPLYAGQKYDDGTSLETMYQAYEKQVNAWLDAHARSGLFCEWGSPSYEEDSVNVIFNLRDFAEDPMLRRKAEMFLNLYYAAAAEETIATSRGGPKMRVKNEHLFEPFAFRGYDLLFNSPGRAFSPIPETVRSTSNYYPPAAIVRLAQDVFHRERYETRKRQPGVGPGLGQEPETEDDGMAGARRLDPNRSLPCYSYVTPAYAVGSHFFNTQWPYTSDAASWQGVVLNGAPTARIAFSIKPAGRAANWHKFDAFVSDQDRNVLVVQKWHPAPPNLPSQLPAFLQVYFPVTLDSLVEDPSGWIFVQSGSCYAAVKVVAGTYTWNEKWQHADAAAPDKCTITLAQDSPVIMVVNEAGDYGGDFGSFKKAIKAQPINYAGGTLKFSTLTFYGTAQLPKINGQTVDISPARVFDSPFIRSAWQSGLIYIRKGDDAVKLDFSDVNNPTESLLTARDDLSAFPPGHENTAPIVFQ